MTTKKEENKGGGTPATSQASTSIATMPLIQGLATTHGIDPERYVKTIMKTAFKGDKEPTAEEFAAFMMVAQKYDLDPFMNQIYAFPSKGGIIPFLGIDGWIDMINREKKHRGLEVAEEEDAEGKPVKTTVKIFVEGYDQPVTISERFSECYRNTSTWNSHPFRMLRHKAIIQGGRVAYGFGGLYDQDEAERILIARGEGDTIDVTPPSADAGQIAPMPLDAGKVIEPESDVVIDEPTAEEPQGESPPDREAETPETTEKPAEGSQGAAEGDSGASPQENLTLEGEPTEEEKIRVRIRELSEALDMKVKDVDRKLKAAEEKGLQGLERLRQDLLKEYNATRTK
jgi:phage recombination protein Bet